MVLERALCAVLLIPLGLVPLKGAHTAFVALIAHDNTVVRASASRDGRVLAVLVQQTQVKVVRQAPHWDKIRLWGSLQGYVRPGDVVRRKRWEGVSHYRAPAVRYRVRAHASQPLHLAGVVTSPLPT
ncbi:MAG: hypothetical protein ACRDFS_09140, partial [Chloroflexota bacterium]